MTLLSPIFWLAACLAMTLSTPAHSVVLEREAQSTLTAVEMDSGDLLRFRLKNGQVRVLKAGATAAWPVLKSSPVKGTPEIGAKLTYAFSCEFEVDGRPMKVWRVAGAQESFYEPVVVNGVRLWLDAVSDIFNLVGEGHGKCRPSKKIRLALQDASLDICPQPVSAWYPNPQNYIPIASCYGGDDCWLCAYGGTDAHAGLDIEMPAGTLLRSPLSVDTQKLFLSVDRGDKNNRWEATRLWEDGATWKLQVSHMGKPRVRSGARLGAGKVIGPSGLTAVGSATHSHFNLSVLKDGIEVWLDPWILFWQGYVQSWRRSDAPRADFKAPGPARTGEVLQFAPLASATQRGLACFWTFGDGGFSRGTRASHVYARPGLYKVQLRLEQDGKEDTQSALVTVEGETLGPSLTLDAEDFSFRESPGGLPRVFKGPASKPPHTIHFMALSGSTVEAIDDARTLAKGEKPYYSWNPGTRILKTASSGLGSLPQAGPPVLSYEKGQGWLKAVNTASGEIELSVQAQGLEAGKYRAWVEVSIPGALNSPQEACVELEVTPLSPGWHAFVDEAGQGFECTPGSWVTAALPAWWAKPGYAGRSLWATVQGSPAGGTETAAARFTPYLWGGTYHVAFGAETPFQKDSRFQARVRSADGMKTVWVEPSKSLDLGDFRFAFGNQGWVEIEAAGSQGRCVADGVFFTRTGD